MKFLRFLAIMLTLAYISNAAVEPVLNMHKDKTPRKDVYPEIKINDLKSSKNRILDLPIAVLDSMANAYAYFGSNNAFSYDPATGSLVFIRRGYVDVDVDKTYTGNDTKNNLLMKVSDDWGQTWSENIVAYNTKDWQMDEARYPSVFPYKYQGDLYVSFCAPTVVLKTGAWTGFITGYWNENEGEFVLKTDSTFKSNNALYQWGLQAQLLARSYGANEDLSVIAAAGVSSVSNDLAEASNFGFRSTSDFTKVTSTIPAAWSSSKFVPVTQTGFRANESIGLVYAGTKVYFAAHGNFVNNDVTGRPTVGFSVSNDEGQTWSEFNVCPFSLVRDYATSQGAHPDSAVYIPYTSKGFTALDNGDVSFLCYTYEVNAAKTKEQQFDQIIEVYYENGAWGVRKVADIYGSWMVYPDYLDNTGAATSANDMELQISRTVDGKQLLAKWVELTGVRDTVVGGVTRTIFSSTDIFVASREVGKNWTGKKNATNSNIRDKVTMIPNYLPNGLQGIPFLSCIARSGSDSVTVAQYILLQIYNHSVGVEDNKEISNFEINSVYPNPADYTSNIDYSINIDGNVDIKVVNMLGETVKTVFSGYQTSGVHSLNFKTDELPAGTYSLAIRMNGLVKSTLINIVR